MDLDQIGQAHREQRREEQIDARHHHLQLQEPRVVPGEKAEGVAQVPPELGQGGGGPGQRGEGDAEKELQNGGGKEAQGAARQERVQAEGGVQHAAQNGAQQAGQGLYLHHYAVGRHQGLLRRQGGDAGLDRGLIYRLDQRQQNEKRRDGAQRARAGEKQVKAKNQSAGEEVQRHHNPLPGQPVGQHPAKGGEKDRGDHGQGQDAAKHGGRAGEGEHVQGQGKAQNGIAEQGDDLADDHKGEITAEGRGGLHKNTPFIKYRRSVCIASGKTAPRKGAEGVRPGPAGWKSGRNRSGRRPSAPR